MSKRNGNRIMQGIRDNGKRYLFALLCSFALIIPAAEAAFEDDAAGARMRGFAGAFSAVADDSEAVLSQPAGLCGLKQLDAAFSYGKLFMGLNDGSDIANSILTFGLPVGTRAGTGLAYKSITLDDAYREENITVSAGYRLHPRIAVGVSAKYLHLGYGSDAYTRADPLLSVRQEKSAIDGDAGIIITLPASLTVSFARQNLLGADLGLGEQVRLTARDHIAVAYREDTFLMAAEYVQEGRENRWLSGMEKTFAGGALALRLGAGWGTRDFRKLTSGLRASIGRFSLDYAVDFPLGGIDHTSGTHYVALVYRTAAPSFERQKEENETVTPVRQLPLNLPGMGPVEEVSIATAATVSILPVLQQAPTDALTTPLAELLDFSLAITSTTERISRTIETSTNTIIEPPQPSQPAKKAKMEKRRQETTGNDVRKAATDDSPAASVTPFRGVSGGRTHKTISGDTLPALAERYYGRRGDWYRIYEANKDRIQKGALEPGQVLIIP